MAINTKKQMREDYETYREMRMACDILEEQYESFPGRFRRGDMGIGPAKRSLWSPKEVAKTKDRAIEDSGGIAKITNVHYKPQYMRVRGKRYFIPQTMQG